MGMDERTRSSRVLEKDDLLIGFDRSCLQFEPDHPIYIRTCNTVYDHINEFKHYDAIYSTRHYGPMIFYLCFTKQMDEFLSHLIWNGRIAESIDSIKLFTKIHPDCKTGSVDFENAQPEDLIRNYVKNESL